MNKVRPALMALSVVALAACGTSTSNNTQSGGSNPAPSQTVTLTEWKVDVPTTLAAGKVTFSVKNGGNQQHELLVFKSDLAPSAFPLESSGDVQEDGKGITKVSDGDNINAGDSQTRTVDLTQPGKYVFVCNLPAHFKNGMYTVVTVS